MREERGQVPGDVIVYERFTLWGTIGGNCTVINGGRMYVRGSIYGNLVVEPGGRVHAYGNIRGNVIVHPKTKVILSGTIGGDAINEGGRLFIDNTAIIRGRIRTREGADTRIQPKQGEVVSPTQDERHRWNVDEDDDYRKRLRGGGGGGRR